MKLKQLLEGPIFIPNSPREGWYSDDFISRNELKRQYGYIGSITVENKEIQFYFHNTKDKIIGCIKVPLPWNESELGFHTIFVLNLKIPPSNIPDDLTNVIQATDVSTDIRFGGRGIATFVYFNILVDKFGYTVLSDEAHMFGGVKLWRKLAKSAMHHGKCIRLIKDGSYVLDQNNKPIEFNDTNFPKSKIWSTLPNNRGKNVLFVISNS